MQPQEKTSLAVVIWRYQPLGSELHWLQYIRRN